MLFQWQRPGRRPLPPPPPPPPLKKRPHRTCPPARCHGERQQAMTNTPAGRRAADRTAADRIGADRMGVDSGSADYRPLIRPMESTGLARSDAAALADLQTHWGSVYEIGLD